jgi:hypothetical protein
MDLRERSSGDAPRHPWEVARTRFFLEVLRRGGLLRRTGSVLDVGAGDAWFGCALAAALDEARGPCSGGPRVTCWDLNYSEADRNTLAAGGVLATSKRPEKPFDLAMLLDVVEHVEDDSTFLADVVGNLLAPDGIALLSVPAWPSLFSSHDVALKHHRRYTPAGFRTLLREAGLTASVGGGLFSSLLLPRAAQVVAAKLLRRNAAPANLGEWRGGPLITTALTGLLGAEGRAELFLASHGIEIPGLSVWALCRRSAS